MEPSQVIPAAIALVGTLAGIAFTAWKFSKAQKSTDTNASYDQIQEDLKEMRAERARDRDAAIAERQKDRQEMTYLQELVLHLDNEVVGLRNDIGVGTVPPLKPRPPRPPRPPLNIERLGAA